MARSLGSLVVSLGLNAAEFTTGLTKSEREAQKFARSIDKGIATAAKGAGIAIAALGTAAVGAIAAIDQLAKQAGNFKDLEEQTGANAEALASFSVSAQVAGVDITTVAEAMNKMTKSLTGVDDESKAAGAALTALGIPIKEFKQMDPATQMETVAKALAGFEDGAEKSAVAMALFGKSGAQLLPFFKELASGAGRVTILNQALIEQADKYADAQAKARAELNLWAQVVAAKTLPAITALTGAFTDYIKMLAGADSSMSTLASSKKIEEWAERLIKKVGFVVDVFEALARLVEMVNAGGFFSKGGQEVLMRPTFGSLLEKKFAEMKAEEAKRAQEDRGFTPPKARLNFGGADGKDKVGKAPTDEADKFIRSLEAQRQAAQELGPEMTILVKLYELQATSLKAVTPEQEQHIRFLAAEAGAMDAAKKAAEEKRKADEASARVQEEINHAITQNVIGWQHEAKSIEEGNEQIREQIAFLTGGEAAVRAMTAAKLADAIASKEALRDALAGSDAQVAAINEVIDALRKRQAANKELEIAKQAAEDKKAIQELANTVSDMGVNAFEGWIQGTKTAKQATQAFLADIQSMLVRAALKGVFNKILGVEDGGTNVFDTIGKLLGIGGKAAGGAAGAASTTAAATALTGAGTALDASALGLNTSALGLDSSALALTTAATALTTAAASMAISSTASTASSAAGLLFKAGSAYQGPAFGTAAVGGTTMGGRTLVGEWGAEMAEFPAGTRISAAHNVTRGSGGGMTINQNIHVPVTANSATLRQSAKQAFALAAGQMRRG